MKKISGYAGWTIVALVASMGPVSAQQGPAPGATVAPPAVAAPAPPVPFNQAAALAVRTMLNAAPPRANAPRTEVVIDPLLDGVTGLHTIAAAGMGRMIADIVRRDYPRFTVVEFTQEALARKPLLIMGSISAVPTPGPADKRPLAVWVTLADTATREVLARGNARALPAGVDTRPAADQADSPVWRKDDALNAYLDSCRNLKVGELLRPAYAEQLDAAALLATAARSYNAKRYPEALALYQKAAAAPGGQQTRTLSGVYLSLSKLNRSQDAVAAFTKLIQNGLEKRDMAVKFLFRPGAAQFASSRLTASYPMWLDRIASLATERQACLEIVGHTSPTGPALVNERLSQLRAEFVRDRLDGVRRGLAKRLIARGAGSTGNLVGTAKDDLSDALDRRVEFKVLECT